MFVKVEYRSGVFKCIVGCRGFIFHALSSFIECEAGYCCRFTARLSGGRWQCLGASADEWDIGGTLETCRRRLHCYLNPSLEIFAYILAFYHCQSEM